MKYSYIVLILLFLSFTLEALTTIDVFPVGKKQTSGIYIDKGDRIKISVSGKWSLWDKYKVVGGEGHPIIANDYGNWGTLLGKIGSGKIFPIGNSLDFESKDEGILYLFPNKGKYLIEKSSGSLQVSIDGGTKLETFIDELSKRAVKYTFDPQNGTLITDLFITEGNQVEIWAFGNWTMWDGIYPETNAEGHEFEFSNEGFPWGKLLGGIGSTYGQFLKTFPIGEKNTITVDSSGILSFFPNIGNYIALKNGKLDIYVIGGTPANDENKNFSDNAVKELNQLLAIRKLNNYRKLLNLPELQVNPILSRTAFEHAKYMILNDSFDREEEPEKSNFTGITFEDRLIKFGYEGKAREMFCQIDKPESAAELFFDTVYHRLRIMDADLKFVGYGTYSTGDKSIHVFDFGYVKEGESKNLNWDKLVFPGANSVDNKIEWNGLENPDPLPPGTVKPLGYPITILLKDQITKVISAELLNSKNENIDSFFITPENDINNKQINAIIIIPKKILANNAQYSVNIKVKLGTSNTEKIFSWNFKTIKK